MTQHPLYSLFKHSLYKTAHTHTRTHALSNTHTQTLSHINLTYTHAHTHTHTATDEYRLDSIHRFGRLDSLELGQGSDGEEDDLEFGGEGAVK